VIGFPLGEGCGAAARSLEAGHAWGRGGSKRRELAAVHR